MSSNPDLHLIKNIRRFPVAGISLCDNCWPEIVEILGEIRSDSKIAYVINAPDDHDLLVSTLQQNTTLPIVIGTDHITDSKSLYVTAKHLPQDQFFKWLAESYGDFAVGVCINEQDKNTTAGFTALKAHGGITFSNFVRYELPEPLLEVTDFVSPIKNIPRQLHLLGGRFEREILLQQTQAQIWETENRFRIVADTAPVFIWLAGTDKECYFFNKGWLDYTGRTQEQEIGFGWLDGVHADDRERAKEIYFTNFDARQEFYLEYRLLHHSGEYRWISDKGVPRFTSDGEFLGYVGGCMDINAQKTLHDVLESKVSERTLEINKQKLELQKQQEFSNIVFDASIDAIAVFGRDMEFLSFNTKFKKLFNFGDEALGKTLFDLFPESEGKQLHHEVMRAFNGETVHNERYHALLNNHFYEDFLIPLKKEGNIYGVLVIARDINDRIQWEQQLVELNAKLQLQNDVFNHAEENALIGSYTWNLTTNEMTYSDNMFRLFGFEPQSFTPSLERFQSFIHPDDAEQTQMNALKTIQQRKLHEASYRVVLPSGEVKHCHSTGNFVNDGVDDILIGTVQDITKDVALNDMLQKQNIDLQNSNDDLASFNYIASHDLQEPLRKVQMFAGRIIDRDAANFSPQSRDYFTRIDSAIQRMQNLIQALLNYSAANVVDSKVNTDLNRILDEVYHTLEEKIAEKKAMINAEDLPTIPAIPVQFQQLLLNLVSNALKYSKSDVAPTIDITASKVILDDRKEYWKISVADNGIGFEEQYSQKIFELFQRLHGKDDYEGTGIGLAICKKIAQNHNGFITAEGTPSKGSVFTIFTPDKF